MHRRLVVAALAGVAALSASPAPTFATPSAAAYVVVLRDGASADDVAAASAAQGGTIGHVYRDAFRGFSARLPDRALAALRRNPQVVSIEPDRPVELAGTIQPGAPANLDRIDQAARPGDGEYAYTQDGSTVTAYVVDTGIRATHHEFGGRVVGVRDFTAGAPGPDCVGHGTFVAGQLGAATYGTAKGILLQDVRVYGCSAPLVSTVVAGVDYVTADHDLGEDAVATLSLTVSGISVALDTAISGSIIDGVTWALPAGDANVDACTRSPGNVADALTVAASDPLTDAAGANSNYGTCIDLFAPAVNSLSPAATSDTGVATGSGSSYAAPLVAGVAALYLQQNPGAVPADVAAAILGIATPSVVTGAAATPNNDLLRQSTFVVSTAYCDAGNVNGKITYSAAATNPTVPTALTWSLDVTLTCTHPPTTAAGVPTLALGTYRVTANGTSNDTCSEGTGVGSVTGDAKTAGPEQGTILPGGQWQYRRAGIHYYGYPPNGDGNFVLVDQYGWHRLYRMYLWFDYVPPVGGSVCPKAGLNTLIGHAQFTTD